MTALDDLAARYRELKAAVAARTTACGVDSIPHGKLKMFENSNFAALLDVAVAEREYANRMDRWRIKITALAHEWADQATDFDEDTEQQIADGRTLLALLEESDRV